MISPLVSIVVVNFNGGKVLFRCLDSVFQTSFPSYEVILVDNGSSVKEISLLKKKYGEKIKLIRNQRNLGYAQGNNQGARLAQGEYLVFLNNDAFIPSPFWLKKIVKKLSQEKKIAFLQPKIKSWRDKNYFDYAGGAGGFLDYFGYPFVRGRIFGFLEEDRGQYDNEREIFWASGVALCTRREVFLKLGGFDPLFFAYAEEADLCFRALRAGYKVIFFPQVVIYHLGGYTSNRFLLRKIFLLHRNHLLLLGKNLKMKELILIFPLRALMDFLAFFYYLFHYRSGKSALAIFQAYFSFFLNLGKLWQRRRKDPFGHFGYPEKSLVYRGSIVWEHFFRRKKSWSEIMEKKASKGKYWKIF